MDIQAFTNWLAVVFGLALAVAPLVGALVAAIKTAAGDLLSERYYPMVAVAAGVLVAIAIASLLPDELRRTFGFSLHLAVFVGGVAGLISAKLFEYGKAQGAGSP